MTNSIRSLILLASLISLPFMGGCFGGGSGGENPLGVASVSQENANLVASAEDPAVAAAKIMSSSTKPQGSKKFSYAAPPHQILLHVKDGLAKLPGCLKVKFLGDDKLDNIFLTLGDMKVKAVSGKPYNVDLSPNEIDLKQATALSKLLADLQLPTGDYNYLEFQVSDARVVVDGKSYKLQVPSNRVRFLGLFSIKDGFTTELTIKFQHKLLKSGNGKNAKYVMTPVVKVSSTLVAQSLPTTVTKGDVSGVVSDYVKKTPVSGVSVSLDGSGLTTTTDAAGAFQFKDVLAGAYTLSLTQADYLNKSFPVSVVAGQVAVVTAEMNPAVIRSSVANTGWFSERYPLADAKGTYGEVALETPIAIDFVSLAFTKVEVSFDSDYHSAAAGRFNAYLSSSQQVQILTNLGGWWVGNNALLGSFLGEYYATTPASHYVVDVTDYVRTNPSVAYYFAARNLSIVDIRLSNVMMTINYR